MTERVGVIGLGNAGLALASPVSRRLKVLGYDLDNKRQELARGAGIEVAPDAQAVARACDILMLCLPNPAISRRVLQGIDSASLKGRLIIENSTVGPDDIEALLQIARPAGAALIECAILGGVQKLSNAKGTFLVGGSNEDFARAKVVLDCAAEKIFYLGPLGNGMRTKLVCNGVAHAVMVVLIEAAALAAKQGIPMDVFYELMQRESGLMRPLTHRFAERIFKQDFSGGMTTANARKDSALILGVAQELGVPLFVHSAAHTAYEIAMNDRNHPHLAREDYAAISKLWEDWTGVTFGSPEASQRTT